MAKEVEAAKVKVKKDRIVAKLVCGSVIPIVAVGGIMGGIYHFYWNERTFHGSMWLDNDDYVWQGNVNKLSQYELRAELPPGSTSYDKLTLLDKDGNPVPIRSIIDIRIRDSVGSDYLIWEIKDGVAVAADENNHIKLRSSGTTTTAEIEIRTNYRGYVTAKLSRYQA